MRPVRVGVIGAALSAALLGASAAQAQEGLQTTPVPLNDVPDGFTLAAVGDLIYLRPMLATIEKTSPDLLRLLRSADVTFGNFETTAVDLKTFKGSPQAESGGTWMLADPRVIPDIKAMGFDVLSHANNHGGDWGAEGLLETDAALDEAGLVHSGSGRIMSAARAPHYYDGPLGRLALVAATTSFTPMSRAADPLGEAPGRAGVNTLRTTKVGLVNAADYQVLARLAEAKGDTSKGVKFNGASYRLDPKAGEAIRYTYDPNARDVAANLAAVRQGRENSDFALMSVHSHEPSNASQTPTESLVAFAHQAIDAGATAFVGHGPHQVRGIEIYKGKPIFYSLGNFAMMNNSLDVAPADMYDQYGVSPDAATTPELLQARNAAEFGDQNLYESVVAVSRYVGGDIAEIRLYPIDLGYTARGAARGVPRLSSPAVGRRVLERLQRLSAAYGTTIRIENNVGVWRR